MNTKKVFRMAMAATLALPTMFVSCKHDDDKNAADPKPKIPVESVTLNLHDTTIFKGESFTLTATILPANADTLGIVWSSNDDNIATVTSAGIVLGLGKGTTYIYAISMGGSKKDSCKVSVISNIEIADANFLKALVNDASINKDGDDGISRAEAEAVTSLDLSGKSIASLAGIEYFVNLSELDCNTNNISALDLSNNKKLTSLNCRANSISKLDVTSNTALTFLNCSANKIDSLNVMNCKNLETLVCGLQTDKNVKVSMTTVQYNSVWKEFLNNKSNANVDVIMNIFDNVYFNVKSFSETIDVNGNYSAAVSDGSFFFGVYSKETSADINFFENSVLNQIVWASSSEAAVVSSEILGDDATGYYMQIKVTPKTIGETEISAVDGAGNKIAFKLTLTR